jgi:hypothetical protein
MEPETHLTLCNIFISYFIGKQLQLFLIGLPRLEDKKKYAPLKRRGLPTQRPRVKPETTKHSYNLSIKNSKWLNIKKEIIPAKHVNALCRIIVRFI